MKKVYIDSTYHYQLQKDPAGKGLVLIEYGTGDHPDTHDNDSYALCPGLDQRGPFEPKEGRVIAQFDEGEKVEVILGSYEAKITKDLANSKVFCGDDLRYHLETLTPATAADEPEPVFCDECGYPVGDDHIVDEEGIRFYCDKGCQEDWYYRHDQDKFGNDV
jgi:hypothetical protein